MIRHHHPSSRCTVGGPRRRSRLAARSARNSTAVIPGADVGAGARQPPLKVLFVCSRNRIRSLTAEHVFAREPGLQVRSAGTEREARVRVTAGHLGWADLVVVMEKRHHERLQQKFPEEMRDVAVACLFIPDDFALMDETLVDLLRVRMAAVLAPGACVE